MRRSLKPALLFVLLWLNPSVLAEDYTLLYGDMLIERLMEGGYVEAWIQLAQPEKPTLFRSLAWTGDEVGYRLRPEGYAEHLKNLLARWPANRVILAIGTNESFHGSSGLADFRLQLEIYIKELQRRHPNAELVLVTPLAVEKKTSLNPNPESRNKDVEVYVRVIIETAQAFKLGLIDLFAASQREYARGKKESITVDGIHLSDYGVSVIGHEMAAALVGSDALAKVEQSRVDEIAKAFAQKNQWVAEISRPKNAVVYYGVRKRPEEYAEEMPRYHQLIEMAERIALDMAHSPAKKFSQYPALSLPPMGTGRSKDDGVGTGKVKSPADAMAEFKVASGYTVNLFASEEQFPELRAPVQMAFDARGRLWVVTMPSFPHTVPGLPREDKLLILEDTDHDGRADTCTVFADGLDALDGVAFHERGVLVSEQPRIWIMRDSKGNGRADVKEELIRGIDVTDTHHGGMIATDPIGRLWFCDGVFHRSQIETAFGVHRSIDSTTLSLDVRTGRVETEWQSNTPNPWKITFDRTGNVFQMYGDGIVHDGLPLTWTPLGAYHPYVYGKVLGYGKGSGTCSISSTNFPDDYQQGVASAALLGTYAVSLTKIDFSKGMAQGSGRLDLVSSPNPAFRPVDVAFGFDGALYISDFTSAIIGHAQHPMRDPQWNHSKGRIWRVTYNDKPIVKDWPKIEGATSQELCKLLEDPRDIVRHHARIELRKMGKSCLPSVDAWIASFDRKSAGFDQAALEALYVSTGLGEARPALLTELLDSESVLHRAAATHLLRFNAEGLPDLTDLLIRMSKDPSPRVRMEVVGAVAHLRARFPQVEHSLHELNTTEPVVRTMFSDLQYGLKPLKGRAVEVLQIPNDAQLRLWAFLGERGIETPRVFDIQSAKDFKAGVGQYRTWVQAEIQQAATLSIRHSNMDISINGVQMLSMDSMWGSEQQVQFELQKGLNLIEIDFRKLKGLPPPVYLFDSVGQSLRNVQIPVDEARLNLMLDEWRKLEQARGDSIHIQAVPNRMQFAPRQFVVKAGQKVKLRFQNPDLMLHNFVLVEPGTDEEIGLLSEKLATQPDAVRNAYVPSSPKILQATGLVEPEHSIDLEFDAPKTPGEYPYICTFPGHWRVMRGVMIVVSNDSDLAKATANPQTKDRTVIKNWVIKDFEDVLNEPSANRNPQKGADIFKQAGCIQCHAVGGNGGKVGPALDGISKKYKTRELLLQILEPSLIVEDKYKSVLFITIGGTRVVGQILNEDARSVQILTNPLMPEQLTTVSVSDIKQRKTVPSSPMPNGLLDVYKQEEILDLLKFLETK